MSLKGLSNLIVKRYLGPFWLRRAWLKKTQWLSAEELELIQLELLRKMIHHCYESVPYYRETMRDKKIKPEDIRQIDDIKNFPLLTKADVMKSADRFISKKYPSFLLHQARTGGNTGTPMSIYRDPFSIGNEHAFVRRQWDWAGIGFGSDCAYLSGRVVAPPEKVNSQLFAYDPFMKELILSTYHLRPDTAKEYLSLMHKYDVKAIVGYPSAVYFVAQISLECGRKLHLDAVLTTSEVLTDAMRRVIMNAFGCKVFDFYGAAERVVYIHTCERGNYHVIPEYGLTELIPLEGHKDYFKLVSTGFWNKAMPFVRYDTGDIVTISQEVCPCGRAFKTVKSIVGREGDVIVTPSGARLGITLMVHLLYVICGANNVLESQVIQDAPDHITINHVPSGGFTREDMSNMKDRVSKYLPAELRVDIKQVESIKKTSSGKIKPVINLVNRS